MAYTTLVSGQGWNQIPGKLIHVSGGLNYVWGVNSVHDIYMCQRPCTGSNWYHSTCTLCMLQKYHWQYRGTCNTSCLTVKLLIRLHACSYQTVIININTGIPSKTPPQLTRKIYVHPGLLYVELQCPDIVPDHHFYTYIGFVRQVSRGLNSLACNLLHSFIY